MEITAWNAPKIEGRTLTIWIKGTRVKTIIGGLNCSGLERLSKERSERQVLLREEDSHLEWDAQTVESYDWEAELWFQASFPQVEKQEALESSEFAQNYELGHTRSVFAMMRVWNSNGTLNVGSMVIQPEKQRAVCRYCGAVITFAQCLAHVNNSEWDAKELFTAMTWAHGYTEMSRNPKITNFAQGEVSIDTKAIWENYRVETTKSKEEVK